MYDAYADRLCNIHVVSISKDLKNKIMIINEWDISRELYFVRDLDTDRNMFIGTMDECKQFQIDYNKEQEKY